MSFTSVETCAGAGGQALGLSGAGFDHLALVENDPHACMTLRHNAERGGWDAEAVHEADLREWVKEPPAFPQNVDLLAGGVPCPPFSVAGKQLGREDERDLFPTMIELTEALEPRALMIENVRGLMASKFESYRAEITDRLRELGYTASWRVLEAHQYGVPQLRPRTIMIALRETDAVWWEWPTPMAKAVTVGEALRKSMEERGWERAAGWALQANRVAPTLVGGSKKHGGADLGPTRAKRAWADLGIDAMGVADHQAPIAADFKGPPKLTVQQAAIVQGFPPDWEIQGRKTAAYRQVGNAFPPPVARAVGEALVRAFTAADEARDKGTALSA